MTKDVVQQSAHGADPPYEERIKDLLEQYAAFDPFRPYEP